MRYRLAALAALLSLACSDMILFRAGQDYFPLVPGSYWGYEAGGFASYDSVAGDTAVLGRSARVVLRDFAPEFWLVSATELRRYVRRTVTLGGQEYVLEERFALEYVLPLVEGASWAESFADTVAVLGNDSVTVRDSVAARVTAVEPVDVRAGGFHECYRVEFYREFAGTDTVVEQYTEWLAPGVGVVKRTGAAVDRALTGFRIGP
jgi:hypothetical protein